MARKSDAAEAAQSTVESSAAVQAASEASVPTQIEMAQSAVAQIEAALAVLSAENPAAAALQAALVEANGTLAMAQAEAARMGEKLAALDAARAAGAGLPDGVLAAMLAAIETAYAPVAPAVETPAPATTVQGRRAPRAATLARNAEVAADDSAMSAGRQAYAAWQSSPDAVLALFSKTSGTRFPSFVPLASNGAGVANYADLQRQTAAVRHYMRSELGIGGVGNSTAVPTWLVGVGPQFGVGGPKEQESGVFQFSDGRTLALYSDGRFRLAAPDTADVRFLDSDTAAYAAFTNNGVSATPAAPQRPRSAPTPPTAPTVPTPPKVAASAVTGSISKPANCQHCGFRNVIGDAKCAKCGDAEWLAQ